MAVFLRSTTDVTIVATAERLACKDTVTDFEAVHAGAMGEDCAGAFVACCYGQLDGEDAFEVFEVGVAQCRGGDFDEDFVGAEIGGGWGGDGVDLVWFVEFDDLDGLLRLGDSLRLGCHCGEVV